MQGLQYRHRIELGKRRPAVESPGLQLWWLWSWSIMIMMRIMMMMMMMMPTKMMMTGFSSPHHPPQEDRELYTHRCQTCIYKVNIYCSQCMVFCKNSCPIQGTDLTDGNRVNTDSFFLFQSVWTRLGWIRFSFKFNFQSFISSNVCSMICFQIWIMGGRKGQCVCHWIFDILFIVNCSIKEMILRNVFRWAGKY